MAITDVGRVQSNQTEALAILGMLAGTQVMTLDGNLPVEFLEPGDRVLTRMGSRRIARVGVTVVRHARVVQIAHDTLGAERPDQDVTISAAQGVLVRDWRSKALFGAAQAIVPASRLADGIYAKCAILPQARLFALMFDEPAVIYAAGLELACEGVCVRA